MQSRSNLQPSQELTGSDSKKLRSRKAAQSRRQLENNEFQVLANCLPISSAITQQLDKATIVRISISFLQLRNFIQGGNAGGTSIVSHADDKCGIGVKIIEAFDGFLFTLNHELKFTYVSETVSVGLGLSQIEILGSPFAYYLHNDDGAMTYQVFQDILNNRLETAQRFCIRMKSNLAKRACRDSRDESMGFKVVELCIGGVRGSSSSVQSIVGIAIPLPASYLQEFRLDTTAFIITTTIDLNIYYCDPNTEAIFGEQTSTWREMSLYKLIHPDDLPAFVTFFEDIIKMSASSSQYLRMIDPINGKAFRFHSYGLKINKSRNPNTTQMLTFINHYICSGSDHVPTQTISVIPKKTYSILQL